MQQPVLNHIGATSFGAMNYAAHIDVVFVHGLSGNLLETWQSGPDAFWPRWLAEDFPSVNVFCASYESSIGNSPLSGAGPSLSDRATILLDGLRSCKSNSQQIVLVGHSLGGLVIKQMLRQLNDSASTESKLLLDRIKTVVFIATPHSGSGLAKTLISIGKVLSSASFISSITSTSVQELQLGNEHLLELGTWFENWTDQRDTQVKSYYETKKTNGVLVVDKMTANPHAKGCEPTAVDANHIDICKPATRAAQLYVSFSRIVNELLVQAELKYSPVISSTVLTTPVVSALEQGSEIASGAMVPKFETQIFTAASAENWGDHGITLEGSLVSQEMLVDFQFYTTIAADDRRTLAEKLNSSGRSYETILAERRKERFSMAIQRHIAQPAALVRMTKLMSDLETRFNRHVKSAIAQGASNEKINTIVQEQVIDPIVNSSLTPDGELSAALVESGLYYLTGNCHIQWDHV